MAATTYTNAQIAAAVGPAKQHNIVPGTLYIRYRTLDFTKIATDAGGTTDANSIWPAIPVRPGETVMQAGINVLTACTDAATGDLGFAGVVDYFIDGIALNDTSLPSITTSLDGPMYFASADNIDLKNLTQSAAGGKVKVWALIAKI